MSSPIAFVGDVHGWPDRLQGVAAQLDEPLCLMGDLIDRGPESAAVVALVRKWCEAGLACCLMGNHEYALVRSLGCPELGIPADRELFVPWYEWYGGEATAASYGVHDPDPEALRAAVGDDLVWMARLPWVITDDRAAPTWLACHAGLDRRPLAEQVAELRRPDPRWWFPESPLPPDLYAKDRIGVRPVDAPEEPWIVSGHVPQRHVRIERSCIACDTSGGRYGRELSAVVWPGLRVVSSA